MLACFACTLQAEDQFQTALRAHLQSMDRLIDLQDSRLLNLEQEFEVELKTLQQVNRASTLCILVYGKASSKFNPGGEDGKMVLRMSLVTGLRVKRSQGTGRHLGVTL